MFYPPKRVRHAQRTVGGWPGASGGERRGSVGRAAGIPNSPSWSEVSYAKSGRKGKMMRGGSTRTGGKGQTPKPPTGPTWLSKKKSGPSRYQPGQRCTLYEILGREKQGVDESGYLKDRVVSGLVVSTGRHSVHSPGGRRSRGTGRHQSQRDVPFSGRPPPHKRRRKRYTILQPRPRTYCLVEERDGLRPLHEPDNKKKGDDQADGVGGSELMVPETL